MPFSQVKVQKVLVDKGLESIQQSAPKGKAQPRISKFFTSQGSHWAFSTTPLFSTTVISYSCELTWSSFKKNQSAKLTAATLTFQVFITMFQTHLLLSFNFQNSQKQKILIFMFPICAIFIKSTTSILRGKMAYFTRKNCTSLQTQYFKPFLTSLRLKTTLVYHLRTIS